jgi:hypothetical protein
VKPQFDHGGALLHALYLWVQIERIVVVVASGVHIPVAGLAMYSAAHADTWLWRAAISGFTSEDNISAERA